MMCECRFWTFLGEKRVDFNPSFQLYLAANGTDLVEQQSHVNRLFNIINLCPSDSSTAASLLSQIIECRSPELEAKKTQLELEKRSLEAKLRQLEQQVGARNYDLMARC